MNRIFIILFYLVLFVQVNGVLGKAKHGDLDKKVEKDKIEEKEERKVDVPLTRQFPSLALNESIYFEDIADPLKEEEFVGSTNDTLTFYRNKATELNQYVKDNNRFTEFLDDKSILDLPIGIKRSIGNLEYTIVIDSLVMTPTHAYLIAYMSFTVPSNGKEITFRGDKIELSKTGGITGNAKLQLLGDYPINIFGENSMLVLQGHQTFVEFDCNGFKEMSVGANIVFSRDMIIPEDVNGNIQEGRVEANFSTTLSDWNDLIVEMSLPDFQVNGVEGVGFSIKNAVFDFSDFRNAPATVFPEDYESTLMLPDNPNLWRGFYLRELSIRLPPQFETKDGSGRTSFEARNLLIDNMGFTGTLAAEHLIKMENGDMSGWAFSLDEIYIQLQANQLKEAGFNGKIIVPMADDQTPFKYTALINRSNEYIFNVTPDEDLQFEVFRTSKIEIYEASYLEIKVVEGKFRPKANLHGKMSISAKMGENESSKSANIADISFESLEIQAVKPYLKVGAFSFGSEDDQQAMAGLPISINNIGMRSLSDTQVGLDFDIIVNLNESFGGEAGLTIVGEIDTEKGYQSWRYNRIDVNKIIIDIDQKPFKFYGQLVFYRDDPVYGNGFNGIIDAEFEPGIKLKATAIFGTVNDNRYWYADAMVEFSSGIPVFTGVGIYGFGGGAYYGMKMDTEGVGSEFGKTNSGVVYVPDPNAGLGLKATVSIGSYPSPATAFNGDATFEISFFRGGGIRYIAFSGNAYIMTPPMGDQLAGLQEKAKKVADAASKISGAGGGMLEGVMNGGEDDTATQIYGDIGEEGAGEKGSISAKMMISYDFENRVLHGNFEMFVNVADGMIQGVGDGGRAGWAVMHFAPSEWYIYIGTPDDRCGLSAGVGPIRANLTSYFMVGTKILSSPPPPDIVSEILGGIDLDYMGDENALGEGKGFAFGSALDIDTGDLTFLMFYSRFQAGLGFDIMLKNYGDNVRCKGRTDPMGVNGWYANGQMYAYFDGKIGIKVKLFGKSKNVEIMQMGAAAVLQTKLPNPFWMYGVVGGYYDVLGGLVKGECKFEVTLGEECDMIGGSVLDGIQVIADATPQQGEKEVSVFNTPQAVFNMPIEKEFVMVDVDDFKKTFKIKLDHFKLVSDGVTIPGEIKWNSDKTVAAFNSYDVFPSEKKIDVKIKVSFQEKTDGSWTAVVVDGNTYFEELNTTFTSGVAPDYIPHSNVAYSYPVINQYNYYPQESSEGYIQLDKGQPYLFDVGNEWKQVGRFTSKDGNKTEFDFAYNSGTREVAYSLPTDLRNSQIYAFELINTPAQTSGKVDRNVSESTSKLDVGNENVNTEITTKKAEGTIDELQEKAVFTTYIRSSQFASLSAKMDAVTDDYAWRRTIRNGVHELGRTIYSTEYFDVAEITGVNNNKPMLQFKAILNDDYYKSYMYPLNYKDYPLGGDIKITWRNANDIGVPPVKGIYIRQNPEPNAMLTEANIASGTGSNTVTSAAFIYNLAHYYELDYLDLQRQVANKYVSGVSSTRLNYLLTTPYPRIRYGYYDVKLQYVLPGKNKVASEKAMKIWNSVPD